MKQLLLLLLIIPFAASAQKSAIEFNDIIVGEQNKIGQRIIDFNYAVETDTDTDLPLKLTLEQIKASLAEVEKISWQDGAALKNSAIALFNFYQSIVSNEYVEMVKIIDKPELSQGDITRINELLASITEREAKLDAEFATQQEAFAKLNGFTLERNELQDDIDGLTE
ncbi:MAG: hypothetical protein POELPBGB_01078 [Bacteroidia bacterium]|nr:hypothetical protein [Bacteroidia bacterium]